MGRALSLSFRVPRADGQVLATLQEVTLHRHFHPTIIYFPIKTTIIIQIKIIVFNLSVFTIKMYLKEFPHINAHVGK